MQSEKLWIIAILLLREKGSQETDHWKRSGEGERWREKREEEKRGKEKKWVR